MINNFTLFWSKTGDNRILPHRRRRVIIWLESSPPFDSKTITVSPFNTLTKSWTPKCITYMLFKLYTLWYCQDRGDPSHVPWRGRVLVLFWFCFDWLDGSDGSLCCRHSSGVSGFSWVSLSAFLQLTRVLVSHFDPHLHCNYLSHFM